MRAASGAALALVDDDDLVEVTRLPESPAAAAAAAAARDDEDRVTVEIGGKPFPITDDLSQFALMEYAEAANEGFGSEDGAGYAAIMRFVDELVDEDARAEFRQHCRKARVSGDQLVEFIGKGMQAYAGRPTSPSSPSGDGRRSAGQTSSARASGSGEPDLTALGIVPVDQLLKS